MASQTNKVNVLLTKLKDIVAKSNLPEYVKNDVKEFNDPEDAERVIAHILVGGDYPCDKGSTDALINLLKDTQSDYCKLLSLNGDHQDAVSEPTSKRAKLEQPAKVVPRMMAVTHRSLLASAPPSSASPITLTVNGNDAEDYIVIKTMTNRVFGDQRDILANDNDGIESPTFRYLNLYVPMKEMESNNLFGGDRDLAFVKDLQALLGNENNALLFVHGFNNSLRSASYYAAKLRYLQNCKGDTYLFDWACPLRDGKSWYEKLGDRFSILSDNKDCKKRVQKPEIHKELRNLINKLTEHYENVMVVCHSMGCDLFTRSFDKANPLPNKKEFRQKFSLLFFAADAEIQRTESMMENRDLNVYHRYSSNDRALLGDMVSSFFKPAGLKKIQHWKCKAKEGGDTHSYLLEREYWEQFKQMNDGRYHSLLNSEILRKNTLSLSKAVEGELNKFVEIIDRRF